MRRRDEKFPDNGFEGWGGYMQAKIAKLEEQFTTNKSNEESKVSDIFNGVSIFVNGFTRPSAYELKALMSQHGGVYHTYQRSNDYIIASNLPDTKVKNMSLVRVVKPEWITESIAANRLLDYRSFLLHKNSRTQQQIKFNNVGLGKKEELRDSIKTELKQEEISQLKQEQSVQVNELSSSDDSPFAPNVEVTITPDSTESKANIVSGKPNFNKDQSTKTAADPNFISEFYNNSRLHHISQLGACFKQHVNDLRENSTYTFPDRSELLEKIPALGNANNLSQIIFDGGKTIMHIDMDCFFVSVGLRDRPELRGQPVAVTHSKGGQGRPKRAGVDRNTEFNLYRQKQAKKLGKATGVSEEDIEFESRVDNIADEDDKFGSMSEIASCSYEARAKGISNGMFMGAALRLCPNLKTIPYDFDGYKEVAYTLYNTISKYTLDIEAVSCDEMYVDCTEILKNLNISVQDFATVLREEIKMKTGCPCSTGFGGNRLQARLATKRAKPDGQFFLSGDLIDDFMFEIKLKDLPGVGRQTSHKLESLGHQTCGSLQSLSLATLQQHLGMKTGAQLYDQCRGRDSVPLSFHTIRKSVSAEVNYGIRFESEKQCEDFLKQLSVEVQSRMKQFKVLGKCITLKLMVRAQDAPVETAKFMGHGFCDIINKSNSLPIATNDAETIAKEVISLCKKQKVDPKEMRGIGIQVTKLESTVKQNKGGLSKFLSNRPIVKSNIKTEDDQVRTVPAKSPTVEDEVKIKSKPSTPQKNKTSLSPKKSPIIGTKVKRRGRPPKNLSMKPIQPSKAKSVMNKFLNGDSFKDPPYRSPIIKSEEVEVIPVVKEEPKRQNGLLGLPWKKVRELLRAWLDSGQDPLQCDIELIIIYMRDMVVNKDIDKLYILINFLRRRTTEIGKVVWTNVCSDVIEQVQNAMIAVYGKRLYVQD